MSVKKSLFKYLDDHQKGIISSWDIFDAMYLRTGIKTLPHTLISYCKEYSDISCAEFTCVDRQKSKYLYIPGYKISGCLDFAKE